MRGLEFVNDDTPVGKYVSTATYSEIHTFYLNTNTYAYKRTYNELFLLQSDSVRKCVKSRNFRFRSGNKNSEIQWLTLKRVES